MATELDLVNKRTTYHNSLNRVRNFLKKSNINELKLTDITTRIEKIRELEPKFEKVQDSIEEVRLLGSKYSDDEFNTLVAKEREDYEENILNALAELNHAYIIIDKRENPAKYVLQPIPQIANPSNQQVAIPQVTREVKVRLPKIDLPIFTGAYEEWTSFFETFTALIHDNPEISNIQRFHYLRASLKGKAAEVIQSLEMTSANYTEAWELLKARFDNKRYIINSHISSIFNIPTMQRENHTALRSLLDGTSKHIRALKALGCPTDHWSHLLLHIIVSKLDHNTIKEWETSLEGTEPPAFATLTKFLNQRCQALETLSNAKPKSTTTQPSNTKSNNNKYSSHVATTNIACPVCKSNHYAYQCESFKKFPLGKRFQIINNANLCKNCLRSNEHQAKDCPGTLCRTCSGKHHTLLHMQPRAETNKDPPKEVSSPSS